MVTPTLVDCWLVHSWVVEQMELLNQLMVEQPAIQFLLLSFQIPSKQWLILISIWLYYLCSYFKPFRIFFISIFNRFSFLAQCWGCCITIIITFIINFGNSCISPACVFVCGSIFIGWHFFRRCYSCFLVLFGLGLRIWILVVDEALLSFRFVLFVAEPFPLVLLEL